MTLRNLSSALTFALTASLLAAGCGGGGGGGGSTSGGPGGSPTPAPSVQLSPVQLNFASQTAGTTSAAEAVTLTNSGNATLSISAISASGDFAQTNNCGSSLAAGSNCGIQVTFTPTAAGARTGTLTFTDNAAGSPQTVALSGTATAPAGPTAGLSPASLTFASQTVGTTSAAQVVTLSNSGSAVLTLTSIATSGDFSETNNCGASLAIGANCAIPVTFKPTATGARSGALTVTDNATGSPQTVALSGSATAPSVVVSSFSPATAMPGAALTITGSGFDATATPLVVFTQANGLVLQLPPTAVTATSMTVAVPAYLDASTGTLAGGGDSIAISQNGQAAASNTLAGFQVQAPPTLPSAKGTLTLDFLQSTRNYLAGTVQSQVKVTSFDTPDLDTALAREITALDTVLAGLRVVVQNPQSTYTIGTYAGQAVTITAASLGQSDQLLLAMLAAQAATNAPAVSLRGPLPALSGGSGCQAGAAATAYNDFSGNANPNPGDVDAYYASLSAPPCAPAAAVNQGLGYFLGVGGLAVAVLAVTLPADAALAALALPTAALLYVAATAAGGQVAIGGALGQTSQAGIQLVEQGLDQMEKLQETLLVKGASLGVLGLLGVDHPDAWIGLAGSIFAGKAVQSAFTAGPPYNGGSKPASTFVLTISTGGTGSGTVGSYPGVLACGSAGGSCQAGVASGSIVFLAAVPASGSVFTGWSGACSGTGSCAVAMTQNQAVVASFGPPPGTTYAGTGAAAFQGTASDPLGGVYSAAISMNVSLTLAVTSGSGGGSADFAAQINVSVVSCPSADSCSGSPFSRTVTGPVTVSNGQVSASLSSGGHYPLTVILTGRLSGTTIVGSAAFATTFVGTSTQSSAVTTTLLSGVIPSLTLNQQ